MSTTEPVAGNASGPATATPEDPWAEVVGQPDAVNQLQSSARAPVHAYMLLGPLGSGRWAAARGFAAVVLAEGLEGEAADRSSRLALRGEHPDLVHIVPTGVQFRDEEVTEIITEASRSPVEGNRKVIVVERFHTANATAIGRLLKTLEEPPPSTIIVLLSEEVPDEQITIASRCVTVPFGAVSDAEVEGWLLRQGVDPSVAETAALAAGGDLRRAGDLVNDPDLATRFDAWRALPGRLDGTGAAVAIAAEELRSLIDAAQVPIDQRHEAEMAALAEREEQFGLRGSGRKDLESAHKREIRRFRSDELRFGLTTLARHYRDQVMANPSRRPIGAITALRDANDALTRNPNEALLLQALFLRLPTTP